MEEKVYRSRVGPSPRVEAIAGRKREIQTYCCRFYPRQGHAARSEYLKVVSVPQSRKVVRHLITHYQISERRACALAGFTRTACRYQHRSVLQEAFRQRIKELARTRMRYGYKRNHIMLKREGIHVNKKRVHSLYCPIGLQLRPKCLRCNVICAHRKSDYKISSAPNEAWQWTLLRIR
jgi:hypothetical protein